MIRKTLGVFTLSIVAALVFVLGGVLYAQQRGGDGMQGGMMGQMMSMMRSCPMMGSAAQGPQAALQHREELGLTDAQVQRLETLQTQAQQHRGQAVERMHAAHQEIARATEAARFDERAVRAGYQRMGEVHTEMGVAMAHNAHEVRNILTAEQRQRLQEMGGGMHGMMQMMQNCPMMQGMMGGEGMMQGGMMQMMENCPMMQGGMGGMQMQGSEDGHRQHHPQS